MPESSAKPAVRLTMVSPEFIVPDVVAAAEYYRDVLGFRILSYFLDELQGRGARIIEAPLVRVYQCYEMVVEDNFGFRLCFAMNLAGDRC